MSGGQKQRGSCTNGVVDIAPDPEIDSPGKLQTILCQRHQWQPTDRKSLRISSREPDGTSARFRPRPPVAGFGARLLAEAVRLHEEASGRPEGAPAAEARAREAGGDFEQRILNRADQIDEALGLSGALEHVRSAVRMVTVGLYLFAALAGFGAVQAAMGSGSDNVVNFYSLLITTLGLASATLLGWLAVAAFGAGHAGGMIGRAISAATGKVVAWTHGGPLHVAAFRAVAGVERGGPLGFWSVGAVTHGAWLVFLTAVLINVLFLLSTRSFIFVWETTILSADAYIPLTRWLASLPGLFGFAAPGPEEIRASEWLGQGEAAAIARDAWAGLLVGSIVVYGMAPRAILLVLCLALHRREQQRLRLDTTQPGFARLEPYLVPRAQGIGGAETEADSDAGPHRARHGTAARRIAADPLGPVAVLGLEIDRPAVGWPPPLGPSAVLDLGRVDSRKSMRDALDRLRHSVPSPRYLIAFCPLTAVPDRGILAQIDQIVSFSAVPLGLVLTGGHRMRQRGDLRARIADWHALAREAGISIEQVIEVDLDNMTDASISKLGAFAGEPGEDHDRSNRLGRAFSIIRTSVESWQEPPNAEAQAELHRRIARLYRHGDGGWQKMFDARSIASGDLVGRLRTGAGLLVGVLPGRLTADPRWLTAGAAAGALGCVAAATLAVPGAIAGLPLWAGFGAALAEVVRGALPTGAPEDRVVLDVADTVRAAVLFALVLDAQGHDETAITRMIDDAIGDEEQAVLETESQVAEWLDRVHMRYREAERREAAR